MELPRFFLNFFGCLSYYSFHRVLYSIEEKEDRKGKEEKEGENKEVEGF